MFLFRRACLRQLVLVGLMGFEPTILTLKG